MRERRGYFRLTEARESDGPMLRRLMQLYFYDFSGFANMPMNADGTLGNREFIEEQFGPRHRTFVIRVADEVCGFAIVTEDGAVSEGRVANEMDQFFVIRGRRREGVGTWAASELLGMFRGPWEVRVIEENTRALLFWRGAIDAFSGGAFEEEREVEGGVRETAFRFVASSD